MANTQLFDEYGNLRLHPGEQLHYRTKGTINAIKGEFFLTAHRVVFYGKKSLIRGVKARRSLLGLALTGVKAVSNVVSRASDSDVVSFELPLGTIISLNFEGNSTKKLRIGLQTHPEGFVFEFPQGDGNVFLDHYRYLSQGEIQPPLPISPNYQQASHPVQSESLIPKDQALKEWEEIMLRFEIGELSENEFRSLKDKYDLILYGPPENTAIPAQNIQVDAKTLEELQIRLEIGEISDEEFNKKISTPASTPSSTVYSDPSLFPPSPASLPHTSYRSNFTTNAMPPRSNVMEYKTTFTILKSTIFGKVAIFFWILASIIDIMDLISVMQYSFLLSVMDILVVGMLGVYLFTPLIAKKISPTDVIKTAKILYYCAAGSTIFFDLLYLFIAEFNVSVFYWFCLVMDILLTASTVLGVAMALKNKNNFAEFEN